ncbi:hypothetical protein ABZ154_00470 [Streptomyces sp. NPDC006261]|uniref:hypothetical protein n=1 Tax=Streptomyces sp. NPDC006261 TaxID=3156739 RepID=UPI0033A3BBD8
MARDSDTTSEGTSSSVRTLTPDHADHEASPSPPSEPEGSPSPEQSLRTRKTFAAAETERVRREAAKRLAGVEGRCDEVADVSVSGLPATASEEVRSARVRITGPSPGSPRPSAAEGRRG